MPVGEESSGRFTEIKKTKAAGIFAAAHLTSRNHIRSPLDEQALIQALRQGAAAAYAELLLLYGDRVYNTVLGMMQDTEDAEDVAQDVFVAVFQHIGTFRGASKLSSWIYRIAVTKSLEALRKRARRGGGRDAGLDALGDVAAGRFYHPGLQAENRERGAILFRALKSLPEKQQAAFVLHKVEGLSHDEIATVLEVTLPAVESLIYRARQRLQQLLAAYYRET